MLAVIVGALCFLWLLLASIIHPPFWLVVSVFLLLAISCILSFWLNNKQFHDRIDRKGAEIDKAFREDKLNDIL